MNIKNFLKKILSFFDIYLFKSNNKKVERILKKIKILDTGYDLIKIGEINNDGSYLVPDALNDIKYCFSPGVGESTLFEDSLKKKNIQSFLADGTISENQIKKINHDYINKNINVFNDENNITMKDWIDLKIKNKDRQNNLLLQMDIEGSEYEVLLNIENSTLEKFKIMVIEFHDFYNLGCAPGADLFYNILNKILKNFYICHIHPNNCCGYVNLNHIPIPQVMEFTFINKQAVKKVEKLKNSLPHKLDIKNVKDLENLKLPDMFYK